MRLTLGFLASAAGSSAQAIHRATCNKELDAVCGVMISNNSGSAALAWARAHDVPWAHLSGHTDPEPQALDMAIRDTLAEKGVDLVLLCGYAKLLGPLTLERFPNRILNVHPAPLPRFGGKGMYGLAVHQAVVDSGVEETAVTIHLVDDRYDHGAVVTRYPVKVLPGDSPESLSSRVHDAEPSCYIEVLKRIAAETVDLDKLEQQR